ncbi:TetR/AcrR family transcriptional regulator [Acidovorax sp. SUPP1855]|uniref:TetR/AcrR family transcriptional regulator n=1 Tax=Acidovorax sp. SUPP1855 TaxID=431774 RepID=UPI0023DE1C2C|nr:TetR family transcriptional regulator [Acidovorax sp. SUPP1855]GKS86932.1 TetR/AcrR family transcriptional regulator [Acidovorax sp. SUPP1855]
MIHFTPMDIEAPDTSSEGGNPYKRAKQPQVVRKALLDEAVKLIVSGGLSAVTVQAVAAAAGVSKGGFLHHFPTKLALIDAVFKDLLDSIDSELDRYMANDTEAAGVFTRAYVKVVLETDWESSDNPKAALSIFMLTEPQLRHAWANWFNARLDRHDATDRDTRFALVRFATDGIWLSALSGIDMPDRLELRDRLLEAAKP